MILLKLIAFISFTYFGHFYAIAQPSKPTSLDVLTYEVSIAPNFSKRAIKGSVTIKFRSSSTTGKVAFDSGQLLVTKLVGAHTKGFQQIGKKTIVSLAPNPTQTYQIKLFYQGSPKKGLVFLNKVQKLYSVYFTSEWMICNTAPDDKATLKLDVLVPKGMISVASGILQNKVEIGNKVQFSWKQDYATPAYTYGFVIGSFQTSQEEHQNKLLQYYANNYTPSEVKQIFQYTGDMMAFFEAKSGVPFPQKTYAQVLIGRHYQEMSGFAVLKKSYGQLVLKDSTETNLISHELAHQWWGNRITCKNWNHFWLNEGFATFMSAAYNEHRFGKKKYQENIQAYFKVYEKIKAKGNDKPLVFKSWANPSRDDRNLVYFKGAYVLHLLRKELGDALFWKGVKHFSQTYNGKSVTTQDFQAAMEKSSNRSLNTFFNQWVY
ncbi:MAG TPA: hypothetical protein DCS93_20910 [Microscillaceae bacterium]|nr:hypothetical protein [Microscillaceae bacterium]